MKYNKKAEKLADFIEANPHCKFEIDNDNWCILKPTEGEYEENQIADDSAYAWETNWYSHSGNYGFGLAEAMVILLNRRGFNIEASAV